MIEATEKFTLDDATLVHLRAWAEVALRDDARATVENAIVAYLEGGSTEDAEYSLAHGWSHVHDLVALDYRSVREMSLADIADHDGDRFLTATIFDETEDGDQLRAEFRAWCIENAVYYYARPAEAYRPAEALRLAARACCEWVWLESLS